MEGAGARGGFRLRRVRRVVGSLRLIREDCEEPSKHEFILLGRGEQARAEEGVAISVAHPDNPDCELTESGSLAGDFLLIAMRGNGDELFCWGFVFAREEVLLEYDSMAEGVIDSACPVLTDVRVAFDELS